MAVFQILNGKTYHKETEHLDVLRSIFGNTARFEEAPDYVEEGWLFDETKEGDARYSRYIPDGFLYDDELGMYYKPEEASYILELKYKKRVVKYIREEYDANREYEALREKLAGISDEAFNAYNEYVLACKQRAHEEIYGG